MFNKESFGILLTLTSSGSTSQINDFPNFIFEGEYVYSQPVINVTLALL